MFVKFKKYNGSNIINTKGVEVVPIVPIKCNWENKNEIMCSLIQVLLCLAWAITIYKSQGLILEKAIVNIGKKEFAIGLIFVALLRVHFINRLYLKQFNFDRF